MKRMFVLASLAILLVLSVSSALAADITPPAPITPSMTVSELNPGPGDHGYGQMSGTLVVFRDESNFGIEYYNVATGQHGAVPNPTAGWDSDPAVSGNKIVFSRVVGGVSSTIFVFDITAPGSGAQAVSPQGTAPQQEYPSIGNGTITWMDTLGGTTGREIMVYDPATGSTTRVTNDSMNDQSPSVSPDGSFVVWSKCVTGYQCDIWKASRANGWAQVQLTGGAGYPVGDEYTPVTNGSVIVYVGARNGEKDIYWQPVGGGAENRLVMPAEQYNPKISGDMIVFTSTENMLVNSEIFAYDLSKGTLYSITGNTVVSEGAGGITLLPDGTIYVLYGYQEQSGAYDLYTARFARQGQPPLAVRPLFDQGHSYKLGSVVPIKMQLLNAQGANVSSATLLPTVTGVIQRDSSAAPLTADAPGSSNPDNAFRYDATLQGYIYNLSTKGLTVGTWELRFTVPNDATTYSISFDLR